MTSRFAVTAGRRDEIDHNFTHHPPSSPEVGERYAEIRAQLKQSAIFICESTPVSREQSLALTKLEEAMFWANAAVARHDN